MNELYGVAVVGFRYAFRLNRPASPQQAFDLEPKVENQNQIPGDGVVVWNQPPFNPLRIKSGNLVTETIAMGKVIRGRSVKL